MKEETKQKIRLALKGKKRPPFSKEWKDNLSKSQKGRKVWNKGMKGVQKGWNKGKKCPQISKALMGRKLSDESKKKMRDAKIGKKSWNAGIKNWQESIGMTPWNKGLKGFLGGEQHHNWKGGISFLPYSTDWTRTLKISIRERDRYTCKLCGEKQGDKAFCVHHIDYDKENCNPNNLITLCNSCHVKTNYNREYWQSILGGYYE